ncbi:hypothetical protein [Halobaculum sp. EA56]|uniref:hypothetical protein n=1 Tax=Halobaculum sp. EA56 TaxID=3421648 RepID=UPI003EBA667E
MSRTTVLLAVAMLVVAGIPATAAFAQESEGSQPGATFAGVVGVQGAEVEGEVASRALDRRLAAAESNESKAAVVASQTAAIRDRLAELRERKETVSERYQSGEITRGEYRAKLARIAVETMTLQRRLNTTGEVAEELPRETLREHGVNVSALAELRRNASELSAGEAAEAARAIGGNGTGNGLVGVPSPPEDAGPPENPGNGDGGPPDDAGPGDGDGDENGNETDDRGEGAAGPPGGDDRGNANRSEGAGRNGEDADDRGNATRTAGAGEGDGNATGDGGPPGTPGTTNGSDDDRGDANRTDAGADGSGGAADGNGSDDGSTGTGAGGGSDSDAGDANGDDNESRGNGNGSPGDGTPTPAPTDTPEDDGDRRVDDGPYLAPR